MVKSVQAGSSPSVTASSSAGNGRGREQAVAGLEAEQRQARSYVYIKEHAAAVAGGKSNFISSSRRCSNAETVPGRALSAGRQAALVPANYIIVYREPRTCYGMASVHMFL